MSRRFNQSQRVALFLAADGRCESCGTALEPGWHADHVNPYAKGGPTDVTNGQALCPTCNLKKGSTPMLNLRRWQEQALARFLSNNEDFLAVATPGAGKTTFALTAAQKLIQRSEITNIIVVVPTVHLRRQWARSAARFGIQLDHKFTNGKTVIAKDFDGVVVTYATVASELKLWHTLASQHALVILDEIHHAGEDDHLSWGPALREAFEPATRRLLLSGTPFRSDKRPIPFVRYENGKCAPSFNYDYGMALADSVTRNGEMPDRVVRPVAFPTLDGTMRWRDAGAIVSAELGVVDDKQLSRALKTAYDPDGDWIKSVLRRGNQELSQLREDVPDAGGLVIASDQAHAYAYAQILKRITGEMPPVAVSDEPGASALIEAFAEQSSRWIVAVQMVSEGVDIPRLAVGVYASRYTTKMFFRQVVGRFVRVRGNDDETTATLFIPNIEPLLSYGKDIERTVDDVLAEEERELRERAERGDGQQTVLTFDLVEPIDSSEAVHHSTIYSGEQFTDAELQRASSIAQRVGLPTTVTPAQMAQALRLAGNGKVVGTTTVAAPVCHQTLSDEKAALKRHIKRKVGRLQRVSGMEFSHIHTQLNRACGDDAATATAETLRMRMDLLDRWLKEQA